MEQNERANVYERVTNQLIEAMEQGAGSWRMPWHRQDGAIIAPVNAVSKQPYRGVNILSLWLVASQRNYNSGLWATYRQWLEAGAQVRKGEKAASVIFWNINNPPRLEIENGEDTNTSDNSRRKIVARGYSVFNVEQVEGFDPPVPAAISQEDRMAKAEQFFSGIEAKVKHGGNRACYDADEDQIELPPFEAFKNAADYYAVRSHETVHWSGAAHRLNRDLNGRFGEAAYAVEELIAELGAAFLCADLGIENDPRADHAAYLAHWLRILRVDNRAIFTASSKAQAAADWLHSCQILLR